MPARNILAELATLGTDQNRKVYRRHGVKEPFFGVSFGNLRKLARRIGTDQDLALALWKTGNHDARVLATLVANPAAFRVSELEAWSRDLDNYVATDAFVQLVSRGPHARRLAGKWMGAKGEWKGRAGWELLALLAVRDRELPDSFFEERLPVLEGEIHGAKNRVKDAMNSALIGIGLRNPTLRQKALAAAARIGPVEVDHGETGCRTPDAASCIRRGADGSGEKRPAGWRS